MGRLVDRLEELLALLKDEDDDGEREDALAMVAEAAVPAAPAAEIKTEKMTKISAGQRASALEEDSGDPAEAGESWTQRQDEAPGADGGDEGGAAGNGAAELWTDGLVAAMGAGGFVALRRPGGGDAALEELGGRPGQADTAAEADAAAGRMRSAEQGLEGLYRQAVQAGRPAAQGLPAQQAERSARAEEPERTAALTVEELDRAVRRDSWRYDGGITIY